MKLASNFEEILKSFEKSGVDFIIAGGYAVIFHGYGRTTGDLDIWVNPTKNNQLKVVAAFAQLNMGKELTNHLAELDFTKPFAVKLGKEPIQIDIFNAITGVEYQVAVKNCISFKYSNNLNVRFIHLQELIINKMLTGRLKDKADVEELQRINKLKNKG